MHADTAHPSLGAPQVEPSADCPRLDRPTCARGEHQTIGRPSAARLLQPRAHALLRLALEPQRSKADVRQREDISAAIGFQVLFVDELAADSLDLPFQRDLSVVQVNR